MSSTTEDDTSGGTRAAAAVVEVPTLTIVHHPDRRWLGARAWLGGAEVELGREVALFGPGALDHARISRRHAALALRGGDLRVTDLDSRNGTFLNGERVTEAVATPGDVVGMGAVLFLFHRAPTSYTSRPSARLLGKSHGLAQVLDDIDRVAAHAMTVLVLGETGTGKELIAREIHERSGRAGPFVAANCGGIADSLLESELFGHERGAFSGAGAARGGLFEAAAGGTLLLDEIGEASPALQVSLLRVLQEREVRRVGSTKAVPVDVRVVAATHRDLGALAEAGTFRQDLYARLAQWVVKVPPLRERRDDIPFIAEGVLARLGERRALHRGAMLALLRGAYPRNVRQLEATIERVVRAAAPDDEALRWTPEAAEVLGGSARPPNPAPAANPASRPASQPAPGKKRVARDRESLLALLREHGGNVTHVARELGVGRNTLYRWLREAGISLDSSREE
jgi:transcriptional regulator with GAF, ATPase, and Fis domain